MSLPWTTSTDFTALSDDELKSAVSEVRSAIEEKEAVLPKKAHLRAVREKAGATFLSKSGWGLCGKVEFPFTIPDGVLDTTLIEATDATTDVTTLTNDLQSSSLNDGPPILRLSNELLATIFDHADLDERYGRSALALSCKAFAAASNFVQVNKTAMIMNELHRGMGKQWCEGCNNMRETGSVYWDQQARILNMQWNFAELDEGFETWYDQYILSWQSGYQTVGPSRSFYTEHLNPDNKSIEPGYYCPACLVQLNWEMNEWEKLRYGSDELGLEIRGMLEVKTALLDEVRRRSG